MIAHRLYTSCKCFCNQWYGDCRSMAVESVRGRSKAFKCIRQRGRSARGVREAVREAFARRSRGVRDAQRDNCRSKAIEGIGKRSDARGEAKR